MANCGTLVEKFEKTCDDCLHQTKQWRISFFLPGKPKWEKNMPVQGNNACPLCGSRNFTLYNVVDKKVIPDGYMCVGEEMPI